MPPSIFSSLWNFSIGIHWSCCPNRGEKWGLWCRWLEWGRRTPRWFPRPRLWTADLANCWCRSLSSPTNSSLRYDRTTLPLGSTDSLGSPSCSNTSSLYNKAVPILRSPISTRLYINDSAMSPKLCIFHVLLYYILYIHSLNISYKYIFLAPHFFKNHFFPLYL